MYRTVIVPLDGSRFAEHALPTAADLAVHAGAALEIVHVCLAPPLDGEVDVARWNDLIERDAAEYLEGAAARVEKETGVRPRTTLLRGGAARAIAERATRADTPLVVLTSHGRTGFSRFWLGSVADGVARRAASPVLMLRPPARMEEVGWGGAHFEHMLIALDGSPLSEQILPHALTLADETETGVVLLHVVAPASVPVIDLPAPYMLPSGLVAETAEAQVTRAESWLARVAERARIAHPDLHIGTSVEVSDAPARAILASAERHGCDVVALATHGRGLSRLVIGSVADKVIRGGPGAVLIVRPEHD